MVLGRLYRDQEIAAIASAGGGSRTIYRAVLVFVLPLTLISAGLSLWLAPITETRMEQLLHQDKQSADLRGIGAGKFTEYSQGDLVFYVEKINPDKTMQRVFVQHRTHGIVAIITADSARFEQLIDGYYLIFNNGERTQGKAGQLDYIVEKFSHYAVRMDEVDTIIQFPRVAIPSITLANSTNLADIAELQRRINLPLCVLLLSFLAVPLAQIAPRGGVYANIFVGFLIYASYGNFSHLSQVWVSRAIIPAWLGGLGINVFLLLIGLFLLTRLQGWRFLALQIKALL
jgi:lipopolysaccharide export system permease protein